MISVLTSLIVYLIIYLVRNKTGRETMKSGDIIELRTIDKKGFISFQHAKIKNARLANRILREKGYQPMCEPNTYFCSHQYEP